jgi:Bacterial sugar transferase
VLAGRHGHSANTRALRSILRTKRVFDIIVAAVGLLLLSPILIVTSVLIKAHSRGPILETETAYGYGRHACSASRPLQPRPQAFRPLQLELVGTSLGCNA